MLNYAAVKLSVRGNICTEILASSKYMGCMHKVLRQELRLICGAVC